MKTKNLKLSAALIALSGATVLAPNTFAADNNYGITYSGGQALDKSSVTIDAGFVDGLTMLIKGYQKDLKISYESSNDRWQTGYRSSNGCEPVKYVKIWNDNLVGQDEQLSFTLSNGQYNQKVSIKEVKFDNISRTQDEAMSVIVSKGGDLGAGWALFSDATCETRIPGINNFSSDELAGGGRVFLNTNISLSKEDGKTPVTSDELFFAIADFDMAQSLKVLNSDNLLSRNTMYAKSESILQPSDPSVTLRNMYNATGNYIYSQYTSAARLNVDDSDILVRVKADAQKNGLNAVFGYGIGAAGATGFYAKEYSVKYISDQNGEISGANTENVISSGNPSIPASTPVSGYHLAYWLADKNVTLVDGTTILAGKPISPDQLKQAIIKDDVVFTAIHEADAPAVPNTGASTEETNATLISTSLIIVALLALALAVAPRVFRKKISFNK